MSRSRLQEQAPADRRRFPFLGPSLERSARSIDVLRVVDRSPSVRRLRAAREAARSAPPREVEVGATAGLRLPAHGMGHGVPDLSCCCQSGELGDPDRGPESVARRRVRDPMYVPRSPCYILAAPEP